MTYTQCRMRMDISDKYVCVHVAWIPTKFAKKGKKLRIEQGGLRTGVWVVEEVGGTRDKATVEANSREWVSHRKVSDI